MLSVLCGCQLFSQTNLARSRRAMYDFELDGHISNSDVMSIKEAIDYAGRFSHLRGHQQVAILNLRNLMTGEQKGLFHFTDFYLRHFAIAQRYNENNPILIDEIVRDNADAGTVDLAVGMPELEAAGPSSPCYRPDSPDVGDDFYMDNDRDDM